MRSGVERRRPANQGSGIFTAIGVDASVGTGAFSGVDLLIGGRIFWTADGKAEASQD